MRFFKWNIVPAVFFAWYVVLAGSTVQFFTSSMSVRVTLEAPLEIVVPEPVS